MKKIISIALLLALCLAYSMTACGSNEALTEYEQKWLINVKVMPENTTDELTFTSSDELIAKINKPQGTYSLEKVIDRLKAFDGDFVLQTMFLHSDCQSE